MSAYVFLDRDGTLVRDTGYPHEASDYELLPGVIEGLRALAAAGYRFAIVTNQSGIGRGLFDEAAFHAFNALLLADLEAAGLAIDAVYFCPHTPDAGCPCRKPRPGLFERAIRELHADADASFSLGDSERDLEAGLAAGCGHALRIGSAEFPDLAAAAAEIGSRG